MKDLIVTINANTRKPKLTKNFLGINGENLQGNIIVDFEDEFINGTCYLEINNGTEKYLITMQKVESHYILPIKSSLLTSVGKLTCQIRISSTVSEDIAVFKSEVFEIPVLEAINASETIPDEYPTFVDEITARVEDLEENKQNKLVAGDNITLTDNTDGTTTINVSGIQVPVESVNGKTGAVVLNADDIDDTNTDNKFVSATEKNTWNGKSTVSVSDTGTATDEVKYITVNGTEKKLAGGIKNYEEIVSLQSLPTPTATSPDFVNIVGGANNGKLYRKKVYDANWDGTDLTGTTWTIGGNIGSYFVAGTTYNINFISNGQNFSSIKGYGSLSSGGARYYTYDNTIVADLGQYGWLPSYLTITFTSNNTDLAAVIENFATLQNVPAYEYVEEQDAITSTNKLSASLVEEDSTHKFVTDAEKTQISTNATNIFNLQTNKQDICQYSTMPIASASNSGQIAQYIGTTDANYTNGYFYKSDGSVWNRVDVQPNSGSGGGVTSLGGATGVITLGSGLTMSGNELSATGGGTGISQSEVINRPNAIPTASASSPDFIQVNGKNYVKKVIQTIADVSNTTWLFKNSLDITTTEQFDINFTSNSESYNMIRITDSGNIMYYGAGTNLAYDDGTWDSDNYKTIAITGGTDVTDTGFITWLLNNATIQVGTLTTVYSYEEMSGLATYHYFEEV